MLIEDWPIAKARPYPNNPRVLRNAAEKVAESIKAFGWSQPIVVDGEGVIVAGHGRHAAAQLLKLKTVPVHVAKDLTPDQVRALRIADNKTATFSEWDDAKLADELAEIVRSMAEAGLDEGEICRRLGMESEELERLLDRSGMTVRGTAGVNGFGRAWVPGREG
jgi:ParB-like chromosome segregation protein Spo0J